MAFFFSQISVVGTGQSWAESACRLEVELGRVRAGSTCRQEVKLGRVRAGSQVGPEMHAGRKSSWARSKHTGKNGPKAYRQKKKLSA